MFFENKNIECVDPNVDYEKLELYAEAKTIPYYKEDISSVWNVYAQYYGDKHGLEHSSRLSFGYMISSIFGGMGVSCSTEYFFKEEEIFDECISALNELRETSLQEQEIMKELFNFIFILYNEKIESYCYKTEKLNIKVSLPMMEKFNKLHGNNKSDKFRYLMKKYDEMIL